LSMLSTVPIFSICKTPVLLVGYTILNAELLFPKSGVIISLYRFFLIFS